MSSIASKQLANAQAYLQRLHTDSLDWAAFADLLAPEFEQKYHPASMKAPGGKRTRNKEETVEWLQGNWDHWTSFKFFPPIDVIQGTDVVVIHVRSDGTPKDGGKQYNNEYILIFRFAGEKIVSLGEFVDSHYSAEYFADSH